MLGVVLLEIAFADAGPHDPSDEDGEAPGQQDPADDAAIDPGPRRHHGGRAEGGFGVLDAAIFLATGIVSGEEGADAVASNAIDVSVTMLGRIRVPSRVAPCPFAAAYVTSSAVSRTTPAIVWPSNSAAMETAWDGNP